MASTTGAIADAKAYTAPQAAVAVGGLAAASKPNTTTAEATKGATAAASAGDAPIWSPEGGGSAAASMGKKETSTAANGMDHALHHSEHLVLEGRPTKRQRVCSAYVAATAWLSALDKWSIKMEPEAAMEVVAIFFRSDGLFPSNLTHFDIGLVKGSPAREHESAGAMVCCYAQ